MDLSKLSKGERIVAGTGLVLFILSFIGSWAKYEFGGESTTYSAWGSEGAITVYGFLVKAGLVLALAAAVIVLAKLAGQNFNLPPATYVGVAGLATLLLLIGLLAGPEDEGLRGTGVEVSRGIFFFIGIILAVVQTYGGYMHMQESAAAPGPAPTPTPPPAT